MSQDHDNAQQADNVPDEGQQAMEALRTVWNAQGQTSADIDEACGNTKSCRNMESVGFHGLADDTPASGDKAIGNNLRTAWKSKLEREGKLAPGTGSVRDLVFGSSDQKKK